MFTKTLLACLTIAAVGLPAFADMANDKKAVDRSCRKDADKIGCKGLTLGNGLGRCIYEYKQKNPKYSPSESCKNAMKKMRQGKFAGNMAAHFAKYRQEPKPPKLAPAPKSKK